MTMFKIWNDGDRGHRTHVEIDGEDVSDKFDSLIIAATARSGVTIDLDMCLDETTPRSDRPVELRFPMKGTRELLIKHGWIPPADPS